MTRALLLAGLFLVGVAVGLLGAFVQAARWVTAWPWGQLVIPWGLVMVLILLLALIRGGAWLVRSRFGAWALLVGWLMGTIVMSTQSRSGDLALLGDQFSDRDAAKTPLTGTHATTQKGFHLIRPRAS